MSRVGHKCTCTWLMLGRRFSIGEGVLLGGCRSPDPPPYPWGLPPPDHGYFPPNSPLCFELRPQTGARGLQYGVAFIVSVAILVQVGFSLTSE